MSKKLAALLKQQNDPVVAPQISPRVDAAAAPAPAPVVPPSPPAASAPAPAQAVAPGTSAASRVEIDNSSVTGASLGLKTGGSAKCFKCKNSVFKMEEVLGVGKTWHANCFTCGGTGDEGCGRVLTRDGWTDHQGQPYCKACYTHNFGPKGFGQSITGQSMEPQGAASAGSAGKRPSIAAEKRPSIGGPGAAGGLKCPVCDKSVFKMEEVVCAGKTWHKLCLTCGGTGDMGCKKNISREANIEHDGQPYCKACHGRLFAAGGLAYNLGSGVPAENVAPASEEDSHDIDLIKRINNVAVTDTPAPEAVAAAAAAPVPPPPPPPPVATAAPVAASAPKATTPLGGTGAPKCTACAKSVYKMEELLAVGRTWHAACFTCGGTGNVEGACRRVLTRDSYVDHNNQPYCKNCHTQLFGPKGFGVATGLNNFTSGAQENPAPAPAPAAAVPQPISRPAPAAELFKKPGPPAAKGAPQAPGKKIDMAGFYAATDPSAAPAATTLGAAIADKTAIPSSGEKGSAPVKPSVKGKAAGTLYQEQGYSGDNDEVDESEW